MAVHRDFVVKNGFLGKWRWKGTFRLKMWVFLALQNDFWVKNGVWGKMAMQKDFRVKNGVLGNGHAKGFLG